MKYVSEKYAAQLEELATHLMRPVGDAALQDTVEFEPVFPERPTATIIEFPHQMQLCDPPELGWERRPTPPEAA